MSGKRRAERTPVAARPARGGRRRADSSTRGRSGGQSPQNQSTQSPPARTGTLTPTRPAAPVTFTVARRQTRREVKEQRRRRSRRWTAGTTLAAVVVVLVAVALAVTVTVRHGRAKPAALGRTQHTLLLQLRGAGGATESALLAHDSHARSGVEVLIPSSVIADVPGAGSQAFGSALDLPNGSRLSRDTLSDLMGVVVDDSWVLDGPSFAKLVDALGGVQVNVDAAVTQPAAGGATLTLVQPGRQRLDGQHALAYATFVASGEDRTADLPRLQAVLDAITTALPGGPAAVSSLLGSLGPGSEVTPGRDAAAALLSGFGADVASNEVTYETLPVLSIDAGGTGASYRIDAGKVANLVSTALAGSRRHLVTGPNRVLVENGVGTPGLGASVRDRLVHSGFEFAGSRNAPHFGYQSSVVLVFDATQQAQARGTAVARALGLPASAVQVSTRGQSVADVIVVIGADYKP